MLNHFCYNLKSYTNMNLLGDLITREIYCFQHCQLKEKYLCFDLPDKCPTCLVGLRSNSMPTCFRVPPFKLEPPLILSQIMPMFCLLLQPSINK